MQQARRGALTFLAHGPALRTTSRPRKGNRPDGLQGRAPGPICRPHGRQPPGVDDAAAERRCRCVAVVSSRCRARTAQPRVFGAAYRHGMRIASVASGAAHSHQTRVGCLTPPCANAPTQPCFHPCLAHACSRRAGQSLRGTLRLAQGIAVRRWCVLVPHRQRYVPVILSQAFLFTHRLPHAQAPSTCSSPATASSASLGPTRTTSSPARSVAPPLHLLLACAVLLFFSPPLCSHDHSTLCAEGEREDGASGLPPPRRVGMEQRLQQRFRTGTSRSHALSPPPLCYSPWLPPSSTSMQRHSRSPSAWCGRW